VADQQKRLAALAETARATRATAAPAPRPTASAK
jgi:hypothetical protein